MLSSAGLKYLFIAILVLDALLIIFNIYAIVIFNNVRNGTLAGEIRADEALAGLIWASISLVFSVVVFVLALVGIAWLTPGQDKHYY